eukprot:gene9326-1678_t
MAAAPLTVSAMAGICAPRYGENVSSAQACCDLCSSSHLCYGWQWSPAPTTTISLPTVCELLETFNSSLPSRCPLCVVGYDPSDLSFMTPSTELSTPTPSAIPALAPEESTAMPWPWAGLNISGRCVCADGWLTWSTSTPCTHRQKSQKVALLLHLFASFSGAAHFYLSGPLHIVQGVMWVVLVWGSVCILPFICGTSAMLMGH